LERRTSVEPHFGHAMRLSCDADGSDMTANRTKITWRLAISSNTVYKGKVALTLRGGVGRAGLVGAIGLAAAYGWIALRGPMGVEALLAKHREIRQLQENNQSIEIQNQRLRERIRRLKESPSEQDMEIRKQLKLQRPGETTFILPDSPKDPQKPPADPD
jgi:cell division protein FtsB